MAEEYDTFVPDGNVPDTKNDDTDIPSASAEAEKQKAPTSSETTSKSAAALVYSIRFIGKTQCTPGSVSNTMPSVSGSENTPSGVSAV